MKASEIRNNSVAELQEQLLNLYEKQSKLRMQGRTGQVAHYHEYGHIRKDIARIKTVMNEKARDKAQ